MDSILRWMGGKSLLRKKIAPLIPSDIHCYCEPFGGAAWVLFYKDRWAPLEVYNDIDSRLVNLFLCVKYHPDELIREWQFILNSRKVFALFKEQQGLTDIQKAARFLFLVKKSFGGIAAHFGIGKLPGGAHIPPRRIL